MHTPTTETVIRVGRRLYLVARDGSYIMGQRMCRRRGTLAWANFWNKDRGAPGPIARELLAEAKRQERINR